MITNSKQRTRKEREEEFRRNLVLDAAESVFAEKGFDGATVSEIAESAELAKGSLYQLFQSKDEIIGALVKRKLGSIRIVLDEIFRSQSKPIEKIRNIFRAKLTGVWENRHFAKIFLHELRGFHWEMASPILGPIKKDMCEILVRMEELIVDAQDAGELRDDLPACVLLSAFAGFSNAIVHAWLEMDIEFNLEIAITQAEELFLHGAGPVKEGIR